MCRCGRIPIRVPDQPWQVIGGDKDRNRGLRNIGDSARAVLNTVFEAREKGTKDGAKASVGQGESDVGGEIGADEIGHAASR